MKTEQLERLVDLKDKIKSYTKRIENLISHISNYRNIKIEYADMSMLRRDENEELYNELTSKVIEFHEAELRKLKLEFESYVFAKNEN